MGKFISIISRLLIILSIIVFLSANSILALEDSNVLSNTHNKSPNTNIKTYSSYSSITNFQRNYLNYRKEHEKTQDRLNRTLELIQILDNGG